MPSTPKSTVPGCAGCVLEGNGFGFTANEGTGASGVLIVAEAPGEHEDRDGLPLRPYAPSGSIIERTFKRAGTDRQQHGLTNIVRCRPDQRNWLEHAPYELAAINHCHQHLAATVRQFAPKVIFALGNVAARTLTGYAGKKQSIMNVRGFYLDNLKFPEIPVVASLHPSNIARDKTNLLGVLRADFLRAQHLAKAGGKFTRPTKRYTCFPSIDAARAWVEELRQHPEALIVYDIETVESLKADEAEIRAVDGGRVETTKLRPEFEDLPEDRIPEGVDPVQETVVTATRITQIQFSYRPFEAIVLPFAGAFVEIAREVLALPNPKCGHNSYNFDNPLLAAAGCPPRGVLHDSMWCVGAFTRIPLWNGGWVYMKDLVTKQMQVSLIGMDTDGRPVKVLPTAWHTKVVQDQKWLTIRTDATRYPMHLTPDHKVWTRTGWKQAGDLVVGDEVPVPSYGREDLIEGCIQGDGWLEPTRGELHLGHSGKQREWMQLKATALSVKVHEYAPNRANPNGNLQATARVGRRWVGKHYGPHGKMFVPPSTMAALAVWYCDDGSLKKFPHGQGEHALLCLHHTFSAQETAVLDWFAHQFGSDIKVLRPRKGLGWTLCLKGETKERFFSAIAPFVPGCMDYKLPVRFRGKYNQWLSDAVFRWARVERIQNAKGRNAASPRYCITVDHPTHRFFTEGGLVANCWHHLQADLPRGLQFVTSFYIPEAEPWKHMADADPGRYGGDDVGYLSHFVPIMLQQLKDRGLWQGYDRQVREFWPILTAAAARGIPVDDGKRLALREKVLAEQVALGLRLQDQFPDQLRSVEPKNGYVNPKLAVKKIKEAGHGLDAADGEAWGLRRFESGETFRCGSVTLDEYAALAPSTDPYDAERDGDSGPFAIVARLAAGWRFVRLQPFKPNSGPQILKWIKLRRAEDIAERVARYRTEARYAGATAAALVAMAERTSPWKVPKVFKEEKETTAKVELERLGKATGSKFFAEVIEYREMGKLIATYVDGWAPAADGAVHTTFSYAPATGQLAAVRPNALNPMKHGRFAKPFRLMIEAKPERCLIELDMTAFHARTLGLEAQDADYMRLAALDIHSFVAAHMLRLPEAGGLIAMPDAELKAVLKSFRARTDLFSSMTFEKIRNEKAKRAILGIGFGLGADKLYNMNQDSFTNKAEAKKIQDLIRGLFPKVFGFQAAVRQKAHSQGFLDSRWGFRRYFWDVFHWDSRKGGLVPGQDAEACIAFLPANDAFGMLRATILRLETRGLLERFGFINSVHDSLLFHCPISAAEECIALVLEEMQRPAMELADGVVAPGGFSCGAEATIGLNWAEMLDPVKFFGAVAAPPRIALAG